MFCNALLELYYLYFRLLRMPSFLPFNNISYYIRFLLYFMSYYCIFVILSWVLWCVAVLVSCIWYIFFCLKGTMLLPYYFFLIIYFTAFDQTAYVSDMFGIDLIILLQYSIYRIDLSNSQTSGRNVITSSLIVLQCFLCILLHVS